MWPNPQETADLVTFIEEIHNGKLHFLCNDNFKPFLTAPLLNNQTSKLSATIGFEIYLEKWEWLALDWNPFLFLTWGFFLLSNFKRNIHLNTKNYYHQVLLLFGEHEENKILN